MLGPGSDLVPSATSPTSEMLGSPKGSDTGSRPGKISIKVFVMLLFRPQIIKESLLDVAAPNALLISFSREFCGGDSEVMTRVCTVASSPGR